jgi:alpha-beta hydrolase superfamily lysophospholipase
MNLLTRPPQIEFYSAGDGRRLAARVWRGAEKPTARVVFLHGITSHGGWYEQAARHLSAANFDVHFLDRRGSGLNADEPGDVAEWRVWIDDVARYLHSQEDRLPTVLAGISWGGKLAPAVARRHSALVDAVALICPGIYSPFLPRLIKRTVLAAPAPRRLRSRRLKIPLHRPELFTNSRRWREFIAQDPLALRSVTWQFAREDRHLTRFARESASFLYMPVLMMLAGQDRIVDSDQTRRFFGRIRGRRKLLIEFPGAAHTLEFEADPEPYLSDLTTWIQQVADGGGNS